MATLPPVRIVTPVGEEVGLDPPPQASETVKELTARLGRVWDIHPGRIRLLLGMRELTNEEVLEQVLQGSDEGSQPVMLTAVRLVCQVRPSRYKDFIKPQDSGFRRFGTVEFPEPTGININMMPFKIGDKNSLPENLWGYWPILLRCRPREIGHVGYLTIHESLVEKGKPQRRGGVHTETPGFIWHGGDYTCVAWGGGVYMASNVSNSCAVWPCLIEDAGQVVGDMGDCEHLRDHLGEPVRLEAGELIWMTDRTPHESLPVEEPTYRQFFRFVTSSLTVWYKQHSTLNPLGIKPQHRVKILKQNKFRDPDAGPPQVSDTSFWDLVEAPDEAEEGDRDPDGL